MSVLVVKHVHDGPWPRLRVWIGPLRIHHWPIGLVLLVHDGRDFVDWLRRAATRWA